MFTGGSGVTILALGGLLFPALLRDGYRERFSLGLLTASGSLGLLFPPAMPLILYAIVAQVAPDDLFVAGILPGVMLGLGMFTAVWWVARRLGLPTAEVPGGFRAYKGELVHAIPALLMPIFVIGTLRFGIATPTEVSVMAVAYALFVSGVIYRDLTLRDIWKAMIDTGVMTGAVLIIIMASSAIQWILTAERTPQTLAIWVTETLSEPWMVILALNLVMIIVGTFLDLPAAVLLLGPLFVTIANAIGLDLVQLGLMMVVNLAVGLYTPPVGTTLFISAAIAQTGIGSVVKSLLPFYAVSVIVLLLISYVPALTIY